jgi:hypothetical protein
MRGSWGVVLVLCIFSSIGCVSKPKRDLRSPAVQMYDLPPLDDKLAGEAPKYPEEKALLPNQKKLESGGKVDSSMAQGMGGPQQPPGGGFGPGGGMPK